MPPALVAGGLTAYRTGVSALELRELFWQNMMREILTSLAMSARSGERLSAPAEGAAGSAGSGEDLFDGRLAVITALGKRIPIGDIYPVFACSVGGTQTERMLSADVQCSIFQIRTPGGEVHTIPVSEVRSFHSLTEDLVKKLEQQSQREREEAAKKAESEGKKPDDEGKKDGKPFGFAAFTQLARTLDTPMPTDAEGLPADGSPAPEPHAPDHPEAVPAPAPAPVPAPDPAPAPAPEPKPEQDQEPTGTDGDDR